MSLFYYARVLAPSYFGEFAEPMPVLGRFASVGTLAAAVIAVGLAAEPFIRAFAAAGLLPG